jgi:nucleotide-binding universal stress UspA family protein
MGYKTILAHVDVGKSTAGTLSVALDLANRFEAHLVGLHIHRRFESPMYSEASAALDLLYKSYEQAVKAEEDAAAATFRSVVGANVSSEWRVADGFPEDALLSHARCVDLVVMGQHDSEGPPIATPRDFAEKFTLVSERPVLIVPHIGAAKPVGQKILLCWNGRREAARAATAALPLLKKAQSVTVLIVDPHTSEADVGGEPGAEVAAWIARHGAKVAVKRDTAADSDVGNVILSRAADQDTDLIVMGLYGHSRMRELVLGGVSRTVLSSMTVPVLVAH